jgi:hypothetical protein
VAPPPAPPLPLLPPVLLEVLLVLAPPVPEALLLATPTPA